MILEKFNHSLDQKDTNHKANSVYKKHHMRLSSGKPIPRGVSEPELVANRSKKTYAKQGKRLSQKMAIQTQKHLSK